jgi:hypothetical protein
MAEGDKPPNNLRLWYYKLQRKSDFNSPYLDIFVTFECGFNISKNIQFLIVGQ